MSQLDAILKHLKEYGSITPYEALQEYGCFRLGARIWDLRDLGYEINTIIESSRNRYGHVVTYARYQLKG